MVLGPWAVSSASLPLFLLFPALRALRHLVARFAHELGSVHDLRLAPPRPGGPLHQLVVAGDARRDLECACLCGAGCPLDPNQKAIGGHFQGRRELDDRVYARDARATLQQSDLRPVQGGELAELFLAQPGLLAESAQVEAEVPGDLY